MVTEKQLIANRQNGKKGGPKTAAGKAAVRYNALKHGLLAQQVVLPDEDEAAFVEVSDRLMASLNPQGALENMLVDIIASSYWRLGRAVKLDTCYVQRRMGTTNCLGSIWCRRQVSAFWRASSSDKNQLSFRHCWSDFVQIH